MCSTEAMRTLAERLRAVHQVDVITHTVDLRKSDDLHRLAHETAGIDILVNNAGRRQMHIAAFFGECFGGRGSDPFRCASDQHTLSA
jgi:NAD(P)-dependent dehydrogenase (short-subunit alcohol dehydrogenase family)